MRKDDVRILRPDPETGELVERIASADEFRPKEPSFPRRRPTLAAPWCPRYVGLRWLTVHDLREREVEYWVAHQHSLTRLEKRQISDGATSIVRPLKQVWEAGEVFEVSSNLSVQVLETKRVKFRHGVFGNDDLYRTTLRVTDFRALLPKRTPSAPPGAAAGPAKNRTDIAHARIDGGYTTSLALAVPEIAEEIDDKLRNQLHRQQSANSALQQANRSVEDKRRRLEERLVEARSNNWRSTVRYLEREQKRFERRNRAA